MLIINILYIVIHENSTFNCKASAKPMQQLLISIMIFLYFTCAFEFYLVYIYIFIIQEVDEKSPALLWLETLPRAALCHRGSVKS